MIKKTSMIVLFFLTIFLISSVSAAEIENETITTKSTPQESIHIETHDVEMYYKDGAHASAAGSDFAAKYIWDTIFTDLRRKERNRQKEKTCRN